MKKYLSPVLVPHVHHNFYMYCNDNEPRVLTAENCETTS